MSAQPTQLERVLRELRSAGRNGIDQTQFDLPHVCDGWDPIKRVAARINDLKDLGYVIETPRRRNSCKVYVLVSEPGSSHTPRPSAPNSPPAAIPAAKTCRRELVCGYERRYACETCLGTVLDPADACGPTHSCLEPPDQIVTGCRSTTQQEARHAA